MSACHANNVTDLKVIVSTVDAELMDVSDFMMLTVGSVSQLLHTSRYVQKGMTNNVEQLFIIDLTM